jgi:hypothetical protein
MFVTVGGAARDVPAKNRNATTSEVRTEFRVM